MMEPEKNLTAIEMFAGIGGFHLGMKSAGIRVSWANDLDGLAIKVYESNFGRGSIVPGDMREILARDVPKHDLLTAGFPCQSFSAAGKKMGIKDLTRGTLFEEIVKVLERHEPRFFFLENVKRLLTMEDGRHFRVILEALSSLGYFVEWRIINPLQFGIPQNRDRVFIFGTKVAGLGDHRETLEELSVFLTQDDLNELMLPDSKAITDWMIPFQKMRRRNDSWGIAYKDKVYSQDLPDLYDLKRMSGLKEILEENPPSEFDFTEQTLGRLDASSEVHDYVNGVEVLYNQRGGARMGYTIFGTNGVAPTLTASTSRHYERYKIGGRFRRLTHVEYARLMGFPDDWCRVASSYDQYRLYGNAVVPACVQWTCKRIGKKNIDFQKLRGGQLALAL